MQQGEYRGALEAAQRRIEVLQRDLDASLRINPPPPPPPRTSVVVGILAVVGGLVVLFVTVGLGLAFLRPDAAEPALRPQRVDPVAQVAPAKLRLGATWHATRATPPTAPADLNGDGKRDVVGAFWRDSDPDAPLWIAAVDRVTLESIWVAGPFPSQRDGTHTHLVTTGGLVVVTDSREAVHVLDLQTGAPVHELSLPGGTERVCVVTDHPERLRVDRGKEARLLDLHGGIVRAVRSNEHAGCEDSVTPPRVPATALQEDTPAVGAVPTSLATPRSLVMLYALQPGNLRLAAQTKGDRSLLWQTLVYGTPTAAAESLYVLDDEVFVFTQEGVHVVGLDTGVERRFGDRI